MPKDADAARDLSERDKHEFQKWVVATVGGQPYKGGKKGMDRGVDGYLHFRDAENKPQHAVISVKGGATSRSMPSFRSRAARQIRPIFATSRGRWSARARRLDSSSR